MIAVDTSVLVAIAMQEAERDAFMSILAGRRAIVGTPTLVETSLVLRPRMPSFADGFIDGFVREDVIVPEPFTFEMYQAARDAFARYGKGTGHPARLNFGDCLSYAVAKVHGVPLLYKGQDFVETDIVPALPL